METVQHVLVRATPQATTGAVWSADLLSTPLARALSAMALWPDRLRAWARRAPAPPRTARSATLRDLLAPGSPWRLLAEHPVVLGLRWPAGDAEVRWTIDAQPFGAGHTLLVSRTEARGGRRFALAWPLIAPFAALLRGQVLRAVKAEAERAQARPSRSAALRES
ncbi:hypothetical protein OJ997_16410 [Solirubrobacter phytolaccae]|uniref:DUF2867 domain-containing protein n=1 Tax=Solirubrobacter phytolaccae TaxID=1404360 RepID=A0A9X3NIF6_9ACTN|nr:hypothetical protein [Solirubrobacter phytolaccae]MDA0181887.1 hypothetical protein [Solirubrobacter phytolaccae]